MSQEPGFEDEFVGAGPDLIELDHQIVRRRLRAGNGARLRWEKRAGLFNPAQQSVFPLLFDLFLRKQADEIYSGARTGKLKEHEQRVVGPARSVSRNNVAGTLVVDPLNGAVEIPRLGAVTDLYQFFGELLGESVICK